MKIKRTIEKEILNNLFKGKIITIYGARRTGKTTLSKEILTLFPNKKTKYLSCDEPDVISSLTNKTSIEIKNFIGNYDLVVLDEAQRIHNIGLTLKLLVDNYPDLQIIATGSSSFELANKVREPLTGRHIDFYLNPIMISELASIADPISISRNLESNIIFGMYPEIITNKDNQINKDILKRIAVDYLFKDLFIYDGIRNSKLLQDLAQLLALRIGGLISYDEIAKELKTSRQTINRYIDLLEQVFVLFRATPFHTNKTKEITKQHKIYFYDTGIRNALIGNFDPISLRTDKGVLFENFVIAEIAKINHPEILNHPQFWRTKQKAEVDYIRATPDIKNIYAVEIKFSKEKSPSSPPLSFKNEYPNAKFKSINKENIVDYFLNKKYLNQ